MQNTVWPFIWMVLCLLRRLKALENLTLGQRHSCGRSSFLLSTCNPRLQYIAISRPMAIESLLNAYSTNCKSDCNRMPHYLHRCVTFYESINYKGSWHIKIVYADISTMILSLWRRKGYWLCYSVMIRQFDRFDAVHKIKFDIISWTTAN